VGGRRAWRASEEAAARLLEEMGFRVLRFHERIVVGGVEVGEVDMVAEKGGEVYAVEVKAGSADVSAVRQAYVNARLLGARPLIVARGADERARAVADELGVEMILLPDMLYAGFDEVREAVEEAVEAAIDNALSFISNCGRIEEGDLPVLEALASAETFGEAAERLGVSVDELASKVAELGKRGVLPRGPFRRLRLASRILLACKSMSGSVPRP